jgi:glycine betaine/proline transport system ATP-binding protein
MSRCNAQNEPSIGGRDKALDAAITCESVWKIYGQNTDRALAAIRSQDLDKAQVLERFDSVVALADVSFSVTPGEVFCVMGLSGGGKSTLVRHINRLIEPTAGRILVNGEDVGRFSNREMRRLRSEKISMVFQSMALFPHRNVLDNVAYGLEIRDVPRAERRSIACQTLELVKLTGWEHRFPHELSGGMQQRVGLARALATNPEILLMDEPFSALDPLIRRQLQDQFLELEGTLRKTTVFITHDLDEAIRLGDRIAIMKDGRIVQVGTPEEIVTHPIDAYVTDFVKGLSKLKLVHARTIMQPVEEYLAGRNAETLAGCPTASPDADLDTLIDLADDGERPIVITEDNSELIGVVTMRALLRGIQGAK